MTGVKRRFAPSDPVADTSLEVLARFVRLQVAERGGGRGLVIGLSGPQGSGKTTLAGQLRRRIDASGMSVVALSLDDFYLRRAERQHLAATVHPLLLTRGVPGTHDVALALKALSALRRPGEVRLPAFDKARDDRLPDSEWRVVRAPVDVVLFEGWCVGAPAQPEAALVRPINALERLEDPQGVWRRYVNDALANRYPPLWQALSALIVLSAPGFEVVHGWRLQQEVELRARMAASGGDASGVMSDAALARFVQHYERLTRVLQQVLPARADVLVSLDAERNRTAVQVRPGVWGRRNDGRNA